MARKFHDDFGMSQDDLWWWGCPYMSLVTVIVIKVQTSRTLGSWIIYNEILQTGIETHNVATLNF